MLRFLNAVAVLFLSLLFISCSSDDESVPDGRLPGSMKQLDGIRFMSSVMADFDSDGDVDLMLGVLDRQSVPRDRLLLNDGTGNFTLAHETVLPLRYGGERYGTVQLRAADFDGDGDIDVLAAVHGPLEPASDDASVMLYVNDGSGVFTDGSSNITLVKEPSGEGGEVISNLEIADMDNDQDMDFLLSSGGFGDKVYLNNGSGVFTDAAIPQLQEDVFRRAFHLNAGDIDDDGDMDIMALPFVLFNDGSGNFTQNEWEGFYVNGFGTVLQNAGGGNPYLMAVQFIFLDPIGAGVLAYQLNESNNLVDVTLDKFSTVQNTIHPRNILVADFDRNGTEDLIIADHGIDQPPFAGDQNVLVSQNLDGTFTIAPLPEVDDFSHDVAIGDIDGDGDIDIFFANLAGEAPHFLINDGSGGFEIEN